LESSGQKASVVFQKLIVNNIENASGIFIGTNQAWGWSSYGKTNQGFGTLSGSTLSHAVGVVHDPDVVDASVRDVRNIGLTEAPNAAQQCFVGFGSIQANAVNNASAIDLGDNKQLGWRTSRKSNYGNGKMVGTNSVRQVAAFAVDNDAVDAPVAALEKSADASTVVKNIRIVQNTDEP
jgi:hypothetical protein